MKKLKKAGGSVVVGGVGDVFAVVVVVVCMYVCMLFSLSA